MLLSVPPSVLIFFEPGVEVNPVVDAAPAKLDARDAQLGKERDADAEIGSGLILAEDTSLGQPQCIVFRSIGLHAAGMSWRTRRRSRYTRYASVGAGFGAANQSGRPYSVRLECARRRATSRPLATSDFRSART